MFANSKARGWGLIDAYIITKLTKPFICVILFYIVALSLSDLFIIVGIITVCIIYFIGLYLLKAVTKDELFLIKRIALSGVGRIFK